MFELRLGKLGLILFIGGMSLLLFSMFFLGIIVGKHMEAYPERFSPGVAELIRDRLFASAPQTGKAAPSAEAGKRDVPAGGEESFGLTFYETLGGKNGWRGEGSPLGNIRACFRSDGETLVAGAVGRICWRGGRKYRSPGSRRGGGREEDKPPAGKESGNGVRGKGFGGHAGRNTDGREGNPGEGAFSDSGGRLPGEQESGTDDGEIEHPGFCVPGGDEGSSRQRKMVSRDRRRF
jgi:hypothetical protein